MTWTEALGLARQGIKVTHKLFLSSEYLTVKGNLIYYEDVYCQGISEFFKDRKEEVWLSNWEKYEEAQC